MALRNLANKVAIPALRWASAPRVSPSAGTTRPLTSGYNQGGRNNGSRTSARKPILTDEYLDKLQADFAADREVIEKAIIDHKRHTRVLILSGAAGLGLALLTIGHTIREAKRRLRALEFDTYNS